MTILTAQPWRTNGHLIADVAKLGYLDGAVLDCTYGRGTFWSQFKPEDFTACDIDPECSPIGTPVDFRALPWPADIFDSVVIDGPYKLNGTPTAAVDERYGVHEAARWQDRMTLIREGITECLRVSQKYVLVKCMDQVCSGQKRWQTFAFTLHAGCMGGFLVDRFDMLVTPRPQAHPQKHTRGNYSSLLVFEKRKGTP